MKDSWCDDLIRESLLSLMSTSQMPRHDFWSSGASLCDSVNPHCGVAAFSRGMLTYNEVEIWDRGPESKWEGRKAAPGGHLCGGAGNSFLSHVMTCRPPPVY